jgi:hypothetical protein
MVLNGKTEIGIVIAFISGLDRVLDQAVVAELEKRAKP